MKKIFFAAVILAAAYTVSAQEVVTYKANSNEFDYTAQVPTTIIVHKYQLLFVQISRQVILRPQP